MNKTLGLAAAAAVATRNNEDSKIERNKNENALQDKSFGMVHRDGHSDRVVF